MTNTTGQERALREAILDQAFANTPPIDWSDYEWSQLADALPHLPATDEGEAKAIFLAAHADGWRGNQLRRDVQHVDAEKSWELFVSHGALGKILSAPTSQPPAAETRLREAVTDDDIFGIINAVAALYEADAMDKAYPEVMGRLEDIVARAALNTPQPEPTAQQGGEEADALQSIRRVLAGIEGNPKGDALDREAAAVAMKLIDAIGKAG
jgi:hypothetical protein